MKFLVFLLLTLTAGFVRGQQPSPTPEQTAARLVVNVADIRQVELDASILYFTVNGRVFSYEAEAKPYGNEAASIAAGVAVLSELRRATTVTLVVKLTDDPQKASEVARIIFAYDSLKP